MSKKRRRNKPQQPHQNNKQAGSQPVQKTTVQPSTSQRGQMVQTIAQERAKHALKAVREWANKSEAEQKELKSYACSFPAMILMSGFGQACAFYHSKGNDHQKGDNHQKTDNHQIQFQVLADWLKDQQIYGSDDLMLEITECDANRYQLAQAEAIAYLDWVKKFS
ncbi:MAG: type III-B CRISPR module-associated protein Cmr5, partial [Ghiorsea sp.]|nr:type III-B CRISPR module-associated protein Cmr5 [Ghiorsea sp.]